MMMVVVKFKLVEEVLYVFQLVLFCVVDVLLVLSFDEIDMIEVDLLLSCCYVCVCWYQLCGWIDVEMFDGMWCGCVYIDKLCVVLVVQGFV